MGRTMVKKQRRHSAAYKFRIALVALEGSKAISQLSSEHEIHPNMIRAWKRQLLEDWPNVFASELTAQAVGVGDVANCHSSLSVLRRTVGHCRLLEGGPEDGRG